MNRIYWDVDKISMLTDHLDASAHSHGMIQLFVGLEDELKIKVGKETIKCPCILVNKNIRHSFKANNKMHFTCVAEPVSDIGMKLNQLLQDKEYYMPDSCMADEHSIEAYANELCISVSRFSHLFREQVGITLKNYLTLHQLERAFQDLLAGKRITEAALNAGFDSLSHFAATVKRGLCYGKTIS